MKALKHLFQAFLRSRHAMGLFRRNALPSGTAVQRSVSPTLTRELLRAMTSLQCWRAPAPARTD